MQPLSIYQDVPHCSHAELELHLLGLMRDTIKLIPGKTKVAAQQVDKTSRSLNNELNPLSPAKLGLLDAIKLMQLADHYAVLYALNDACGHTAIAIADYSAASDLELLDVYAQMHAKVGCLASEVAQSQADNHVTHDKVLRVRSAGFEMVRAFFAFLARLDAISE